MIDDDYTFVQVLVDMYVFQLIQGKEEISIVSAVLKQLKKIAVACL